MAGSRAEGSFAVPFFFATFFPLPLSAFFPFPFLVPTTPLPGPSVAPASPPCSSPSCASTEFPETVATLVPVPAPVTEAGPSPASANEMGFRLVSASTPAPTASVACTSAPTRTPAPASARTAASPSPVLTGFRFLSLTFLGPPPSGPPLSQATAPAPASAAAATVTSCPRLSSVPAPTLAPPATSTDCVLNPGVDCLPDSSTTATPTSRCTLVTAADSSPT